MVANRRLNSKTTFRLCLVLSAAVCVVFACGCGADSATQERITAFHVQLHPEADRGLRVEEQLEVFVAGNKIKRGIYREVLRTHQGRDCQITDVETWRDGVSVPHLLERQGERSKIRIIAPTLLSHGSHTFRITYRVNSRIDETSEGYALDWNATGMRWAFPIEDVRVVLAAPEAAVFDSVRASAIRERSTTASIAPQVNQPARTLSFQCDTTCAPGDSFSIRASWPKNVTAKEKAE